MLLNSCLFDKDIHWWMLNEINVLTPLLFHLIVAKPFKDDEKVNMDPILWIQVSVSYVLFDDIIYNVYREKIRIKSMNQMKIM